MPSRLLPGWLRVALALLGVGWGANQFAPLLLVYRLDGHLSETAVTAMFGVYALGLIPALLVAGPLTDRHGRRSVLRPVLLVSGLTSVVLIAGSVEPSLLYVGRFLAGVASGCAFTAGTAWLKDQSASLDEGTGARRAAIALSAGFGGGPLVAGALAQWAPAPEVLPYLAHLALMALVVPLVWRVPESPRAITRAERGRRPWPPRRLLHPSFTLGVVPWAPWVFGTATVAFATLPSLIASKLDGEAVVFNGAIAGLALLAGILVQPLGRQLGRRQASLPTTTGLLLAAVGLALGAVTAATRDPAWVPVTAVVLGSSYGVLLVAGLQRVEALADAADLGAGVAIYYAVTYLGFGAPYLLAAVGPEVGYARCLLAGGAIVLLTLVLALAGGRRRHAMTPVVVSPPGP